MPLALLLVVGVLVVREGVRWLVHGRRSIFAMRAPVSIARRGAALVAGLVAMYLAVVAIAYVHQRVYGQLGPAHYAVADVLAGTPADGVLVAGDRIDALDGQPISPGVGPSFAERVRVRTGEIELVVVRDGTPRTIRITPQQGLIGIRVGLTHARETAGALGRALAAPVRVLEPARAEPETGPGGPGSVVAMANELLRAAGPDELAFVNALWLASALLLLAAVFDLVRLALVIRDRVRG